MAGVNFSFDLGPVSGSKAQHSTAGQSLDANDAAVGVQFQSAQKSMQAASGSAHPVVNSPACDGGGCFVVHGEGPGVTTLSMGEEDGGAGGYISLPVVDGSQFLEPPVQSFASAGDYEITTLAIGEEDGGMASASPAIGAAEPAMSQSGGGIVDYVEQTTLETYAPYEPSFADGIETANVSETFGVMDPVYSVGDTQWSSAPYSVAETQTDSIATTPIADSALGSTEVTFASPRLKPEAVASAGSPLPEPKPATAPTSIVSASASTEASISAPISAPAPAGNFVSVGDYDSYIASVGGSSTETSAPTTSASTDSVDRSTSTDAMAAPQPTYVIEENATDPSSITTTHESGAVQSQPEFVIQESAPVSTGSGAVGSETASPQPTYVIHENAEPQSIGTTALEGSPATSAAAPEPTYVIQENAEQAAGSSAMTEVETSTTTATSEPAYVIQESPVDSNLTPRIKPASATTPEPVYTINSPTDGGAADLTRGSTFTTTGTPVPLEKPEGVSIDAPRLSEEDYRITTLALGEEEAGGG